MVGEGTAIDENSTQLVHTALALERGNGQVFGPQSTIGFRSLGDFLHNFNI